MNLRHLHFFVVLSEEMNFSRAAERLHVAQPALSYQIRTMEDQMGAQLVDRTSRPLKLTDAGSYFYAEARQILAAYERALLGVREIEAHKRGWLGIGFTRSAMYSILPQALKDFQRQHPCIELKLFEMLTEEQADALREHRIHVGIGRRAQPIPNCSTTTVLEEELVLLVPSDHPLSKLDQVPVESLSDVPIILYPDQPTAQFPKLIESICRDAGFAPNVAFRSHEIQTAIALVSAGLGVTFCGRSVALHARTDIVCLSLTGLTADQARTGLTATHRGDDSTPSLHAFLEVLKECANA